MTKLEKVISGLWHCERNSCNNCPYAGRDEDGRSPYKTCKQLEMIGDALAMLKDPDRLKVVRCQNCKHHGSCGYEDIPGWFCADGERNEE